MTNFDDVIDPDENIEALAEAMGRPIQEEVMILELLNKTKIKVRYKPQSIAASIEYDNGRPIKQQGRKPAKMDFQKWAKETLPKLNDLALLNIEIVADKPDQPVEKGQVRLSLIAPGVFWDLFGKCFPGSSDLEDLEDEAIPNDRKVGKGIRGRKSDAPSA